LEAAAQVLATGVADLRSVRSVTLLDDQHPVVHVPGFLGDVSGNRDGLETHRAVGVVGRPSGGPRAP
jgi:hypothetical protein